MKKSFVFTSFALLSLILSGCNTTSPSKKKKSSKSSPLSSGLVISSSGETSDTSDSSYIPVTSISGTSVAPSTGTTIPTSSGTSTSVGPTTSTSTTHTSSSSPTSTPLPDDYYASIDGVTDDNLLSALRTLNSKKRTSTVGYSAMGTTASGMFKYTDYDPSTIQYDSKGQPYGTAIVSFYSGNTMTSFNREHVWPNTHGGSKVESDIHMTRPTIPSENGSRGHSFYIEGMKTKDNTGWDPAMESFGKESYRGDCARIIFYCMVAVQNNDLILVDDKTRSSYTKNNEMGIISDMLSWNLRYPVNEREQRRNAGAQYLQGNRNPFIDHPEYACRIWGGTNSTTKQICGMN